AQIVDGGLEVAEHALVGKIAYPAEDRGHVGQRGSALAAVEIDREREEALVREAAREVAIVLPEPAHVGDHHQPGTAVESIGPCRVRLQRVALARVDDVFGHGHPPPPSSMRASAGTSRARWHSTPSQSPCGSSKTPWSPAARAPRTSTA